MIYTDSDRIFNNQGLELGLLLLMLMCGVLLVFVLLYTKNTTTNMPVTNQMGIGLFDQDLKYHPECETVCITWLCSSLTTVSSYNEDNNCWRRHHFEFLSSCLRHHLELHLLLVLPHVDNS